MHKFIRLTNFNGAPICLNTNFIKSITQINNPNTPAKTCIRIGKKLVIHVKEDASDILAMIK